MPGTFFFYQLFELFAIQNSSYDSSKRLNDNVLLLVFSLPYLYDFATGIVSVVLMSRIANFNGILEKIKTEDDEAVNKLLKEVLYFILLQEIEKLNQKYSYDHLKREFERREFSMNNGEKL